MRAIVTTANGDVSVMKVEQRPDPVPSAGEVLVRVNAAGLNFADILARQGLYPDGPPKPCVMGYEVAGLVEDAGEGVDRNLMGKAVIAMTRFKGQAELLVVSAAQVLDRKSTRLNSSHSQISYAVFCLKKKNQTYRSLIEIRSNRATATLRA